MWGGLCHPFDDIPNPDRPDLDHAGPKPAPPHQRVERLGLAGAADQRLARSTDSSAFEDHILADGEPNAAQIGQRHTLHHEIATVLTVLHLDAELGLDSIQRFLRDQRHRAIRCRPPAERPPSVGVAIAHQPLGRNHSVRSCSKRTASSRRGVDGHELAGPGHRKQRWDAPGLRARACRVSPAIECEGYAYLWLATDCPMPIVRHLTFENAHGQQLAARLDLPDGEIRAYALFAHCFTCSKDLHVVRRVAKALSACGIAMMGVDFTGLGQSEGDFSHTTFSTTVDDLVRAANELATAHEAPQILIGHSLGGAAVLAAAHQIPSARAIATINSPFDPDHVRHLFVEAEPEIEARGEAVVDLGGRPFCIRRQFLQDLDSQASMQERIRQLDCALLIFHSPVDQTVGIEQAKHLYDAARHPKSFVSLDGADHLLTNPADALYVGNVLAAWAERFLEPPNEQPETEPDYANPMVTARTGPTGFRTELTARGFELAADEPASVGGTETAPTPYDYLGMALAACTSMTVQMYARRKGIQLDDVQVSVTHAKVHATDCQHCETREGYLDRLTRTVILTGDVADAERARLLEIANRCPVHRTLENEIDVVTVAAPTTS